MEPKPQKVVAAVIYSDDKKSILIGRRAENDGDFPGKWEFIGGGVEEGESLKAALNREIAEEVLGGKEDFEMVGEPLGEARFEGDKGQIVVTFFESKLEGMEPKLDPKIHQNLEFVKIKNLLDFDWVGANGEFARWFVEFNRNRQPITGDIPEN